MSAASAVTSSSRLAKASAVATFWSSPCWLRSSSRRRFFASSSRSRRCCSPAPVSRRRTCSRAASTWSLRLSAAASAAARALSSSETRSAPSARAAAFLSRRSNSPCTRPHSASAAARAVSAASRALRRSRAASSSARMRSAPCLFDSAASSCSCSLSVRTRALSLSSSCWRTSRSLASAATRCPRICAHGEAWPVRFFPLAVNASSTFSCTAARMRLKRGSSARACSASLRRSRPESSPSPARLVRRMATTSLCSPSRAVVMNDSAMPRLPPGSPGPLRPQRRMPRSVPSTSRPLPSCVNSLPSREKLEVRVAAAAEALAHPPDALCFLLEGERHARGRGSVPVAQWRRGGRRRLQQQRGADRVHQTRLAELVGAVQDVQAGFEVDGAAAIPAQSVTSRRLIHMVGRQSVCRTSRYR